MKPPVCLKYKSVSLKTNIIVVDCFLYQAKCILTLKGYIDLFSVDKKNQLDVTFRIFYFSSNSCLTYFGQPCAHHQEMTTA